MNDVDNEMIEIFTEECISILADLKEIRSQAVSNGCYTFENIQDIFRSIHTLKADATMMFYEHIAEVSRAFESVLYFLRDEEKEIKDQSRFHYLMEYFTDFVTQELEKIESGKEADGTNKSLLALIGDYPLTNEQRVTAITDPFQDKLHLEEEMDGTVSEEIAKKISSFYIPADIPDSPKKETEPPETYVIPSTEEKCSKASKYIEKVKKEVLWEEESQEEILPRQIAQYNRRKHTIITEEEISCLQQELSEYKQLVESYEERLKKVSVIGLTCEDMEKYRRHARHLERFLRQITTTDFTQLTEKMQGVVREMTRRLNKKVELVVAGEKTLIEKNKKEKLAGAMIHILRNAIDHGIEDEQTRIAQGKNPVGTVLINITKKKGDHIRIDITDDGKGFDEKKILQKAKEKGMLYKPEEEYSSKEIFNMTMFPGFSTSNKISDYSGRGVGMDVVRHNIEAIGGTLNLNSKLGKGTKMSIFL